LLLLVLVRRQTVNKCQIPDSLIDKCHQGHMAVKSPYRTDDAFWASGRSSQSHLNTPLFRRK
jgi:hypothetical protein